LQTFEENIYINISRDEDQVRGLLLTVRYNIIKYYMY